MSRTKWLLPLLLAASLGHAQSPALAQSPATCGLNGTTTTCAATFGSAVGARNLQLWAVALGAYAGTRPTFVSIADSAGDSPTLVAIQTWGTNLEVRIYAVINSIGGSNAVTLTVTSGNTSYNAASLVALEYNTVAATSIEYVTKFVGAGSYASLATNTAYSLTANTRAIAIGASMQGATTGYTATGFTTDGFKSQAGTSGGATSIGLLGQNLASATSISATVSTASVNLDIAGLIIIRSALPAVGAVQRNWCTTSTNNVASIACPMLPSLSGDMGLATIYANMDTDLTSAYIPVVTDSTGTVWSPVPASFNGGDNFNGRYLYFRPNLPAGVSSVSVAARGGGNQQYDVEVKEIHGVASTTPLLLSAMQTASGTTAIAPSAVPVPAGTYFADFVISDLTASNTYTTASGFTPVLPTSSSTTLAWKQSQEETVTFGGAGSIAPTSTATSAVTTAVYLVAVFQSLSNSYVHLVQATHGGSSSVSGINNPIRQYLVNTVAGNDLYAIGTWGNTGAAGTLTSSPSLTWTPVCSQSQFEIWRSPATPAGLYTVTLTVSPNGGYPSVFIVETSPGVIDSSICAAATGTSVSSGNVTTTAANDLILSVGSANDSACTGIAPIYGGTGYTQYGDGTSHCTTQTEWVQYGASSGSVYSNSFTSASSAQLNAAVIAIKLSSPAVITQPVVNIITKLNRMLAAPNIGVAAQIAAGQ